MEKHIRIRVGPSPTGDPHIGTAYIALFNYAFAKKYLGKIIIRIEDTDRSRSSKKSEFNILKYLRWLNLIWDEGPDIDGKYGPYRQSQRLNIYKNFSKILLKNGHAYWCSCDKKRLDKLRDTQKASNIATKYDKFCLQKTRKKVFRDILATPGIGVIRLNVPKNRITKFYDVIRGPISVHNSNIDDQILIKSDTFPTYHFASVIDDHLMKITHVIRGEEWISSTFKHIMIYRALNFLIPYFCHLPLLRLRNNKKISKRTYSNSLEYYKAIGIFPEVVVNFLGLVTISHKNKSDIFSIESFIYNFSLNSIVLGSPTFNISKLIWLNSKYIRERFTEQVLLKKVAYQMLSLSYIKNILAILRDRISRQVDFFQHSDFFFKKNIVRSVHSESIISNKIISVFLYKYILNILLKINYYSAFNIENVVKRLSRYYPVKKKKLIIAIKTILGSKKDAPPIFLIISIMGRQKFLSRITEYLFFISPQ